ncbi:MAG: penicillin-binding protein 1C [Gemmatimonadota bacterium]|nr:penicillin-binding protein 1C [Gemmatimonadota bacterium]
MFRKWRRIAARGIRRRWTALSSCGPAKTGVLLALLLSPAVLYVSIPLPDPLFEPDYSTVVLDERGRILRMFLNGDDQWCFPHRANAVVPLPLEQAVLLFEDRRFYRHPGVDPLALLRAVYQNIRSGTVVSGASTLTMQIARMTSQRKRTYLNKALEMLQAMKIERHYDKKQILNLYMDHAPYGGNIVGYRAAAQRYFGKSPERLTWGEAATLAVLPNAPGLISPLADPEELRLRRDRLLNRLRSEGKIDAETFGLARLEKVPDGVRPLPMDAPHLARRLASRHGNTYLKTTLHRDIQRQSAELVNRHAAFMRQRGVRNGAALVADTRSGKVRAYVGSQGFVDDRNQGRVDGVAAARSSGSLLKPFLFALGIDQGLLLPRTRLRDLPTHYGAYSPGNADGNFAGLVTAREALVRSLNVPAVRLLDAYGTDPFFRFLESAGLTTLIRSPGDYGLPMILGGVEVSLWDMAQSYRALANGGRFSPLRVLAGTPDPVGPALISPGACYLTLDMLRDLTRPGVEYYWHQYQNQWPIAWKTGTSYGKRDAWAIGVSPEWTVAVWIGNFGGRGNADLTGANSAAPLLFDLFNQLPKQREHVWIDAPVSDLRELQLCADTGFRAGMHCERRVSAEAPLHMKPLRSCPYHRTLQVTLDGSHRVCSLCWEPGDRRPVSRLVFPADVSQHLRERGQVQGMVPPHKPDCPAGAGSDPLKIVYPRHNARLWLPRDFGGARQKVAMRVAHRDKKRVLYWYLDDRYLGSSRGRHVKAAELARGWHTLNVVDESGNRDRKRFFVDLKQLRTSGDSSSP